MSRTGWQPVLRGGSSVQVLRAGDDVPPGDVGRLRRGPPRPPAVLAHQAVAHPVAREVRQPLLLVAGRLPRPVAEDVAAHDVEPAPLAADHLPRPVQLGALQLDLARWNEETGALGRAACRA